MNIICKKYLYKVVVPSNKSRLLTTWTEDKPIEEFDSYESLRFPFSVSDVEIENKYHEITRKRAEKLWLQKQGKPVDEPVDEPITENTPDETITEKIPDETQE